MLLSVGPVCPDALPFRMAGSFVLMCLPHAMTRGCHEEAAGLDLLAGAHTHALTPS